jgi:hypothetical protein
MPVRPRRIGVTELIVGTEALASGRVTRQDLRARYVKLHRNIYAPVGLELTPFDRAIAAWLWARGDAILVGGFAR